jgi:ribosomal protein S14
LVEWLEWSPVGEERWRSGVACGRCGERDAVVRVDGTALCGPCVSEDAAGAILVYQEEAGPEERCEECGAAVGAPDGCGSLFSFGHLAGCSLAVADGECDVEGCEHQAVDMIGGEVASCAAHASVAEELYHASRPS